MKSKIILEMRGRIAQGLVQYCHRNGMTRAGFIRKLVYDRICEHHEEFKRGLFHHEVSIKEEMEEICGRGEAWKDVDE